MPHPVMDPPEPEPTDEEWQRAEKQAEKQDQPRFTAIGSKVLDSNYSDVPAGCVCICGDDGTANRIARLLNADEVSFV